jgi:hypothetical protein
MNYVSSLKQRDKCDGESQKANRQLDVKGGEFDVIGRNIPNMLHKLDKNNPSNTTLFTMFKKL